MALGDITATHAPAIDAPLGYEQITSLTAAATLTVPVGATWAVVQCESVDVRYRDDGTAPTSSVGMILAAGTSVQYTGNLYAIQFIRTAAGSKLNVSYYK